MTVNELDGQDAPVQMTVHGLGQAPKPAGATPRDVRWGRIKALLVLLVCASPVVASYLSFYVWRPQVYTNYGELIQPTVDMPAFELQEESGRVLPSSELRQQWLFVAVGSGQCDSLCERRLYIQRQIREGLGKDKDRMEKVWLVTDDAPVAAPLRKGLGDARVLRARADDVSRWLKPAPGHRLDEHLYVVDPMGRWMMRFPVDPDVKKLRKDLERLLKASASWDQAGRPAEGSSR